MALYLAGLKGGSTARPHDGSWLTAYPPQPPLAKEAHMASLTIDRLKDLLRISAGEDEVSQLGGDITATSFSELGYDSLALIETAALINREYGIDVTDEIDELETPGALLDFVNDKLAA